jgi:hypothetical protein
VVMKSYMIKAKTSSEKSILIDCDKIVRKYHPTLESNKLYFWLDKQIVFAIDLDEYKIKYLRKLDSGCLIFELLEVHQ